jgi:hypothetical protein
MQYQDSGGVSGPSLLKPKWVAAQLGSSINGEPGKG